MFLEQSLNDDFLRQGYVIIRTGKPELFAEIRNEFDADCARFPMIEKGFVNTSEIASDEFKSSQNGLLQSYSDAIFQDVFRDKMEIVPEVFFIKIPGGNSEVSIHQDAVIVDERVKIGLHCWIPLQDSSEENGGLQLIPGSHRLSNPHRAYSIPWRFEGQDHVLKKFLVPVSLQLGDFIIYERSVIHYSPENKSAENRVAMAYSAAQAPLQFLHLLANEAKGEVEFYEVTPDFLLHGDPFAKPEENAIPFRADILNTDCYTDRQLEWLCTKVERMTKSLVQSK